MRRVYVAMKKERPLAAFEAEADAREYVRLMGNECTGWREVLLVPADKPEKVLRGDAR